MPKMKSKRALMKRIKVTGSGKLKVQHNYVSHFAANKSHKQKMHLKKSTVSADSDFKRDRQLLQG